MASSLTTAAASSGIIDAIERTRTGTAAAVGQEDAVVEQAVLLVPQIATVQGLPR